MSNQEAIRLLKEAVSYKGDYAYDYIMKRIQEAYALFKVEPEVTFGPTSDEIQAYISAGDGDISEKEARYLLEINFWKAKSEAQAAEIKELKENDPIATQTLRAEVEGFVDSLKKGLLNTNNTHLGDLYGYKGEVALQKAIDYIQHLLYWVDNERTFRKSYSCALKRNTERIDEIKKLRETNEAQAAEIKEKKSVIEQIQRISCGEDQVADDDSEGMGVIYRITKKAIG